MGTGSKKWAVHRFVNINKIYLGGAERGLVALGGSPAVGVRMLKHVLRSSCGYRCRYTGRVEVCNVDVPSVPLETKLIFPILPSLFIFLKVLGPFISLKLKYRIVCVPVVVCIKYQCAHT